MREPQLALTPQLSDDILRIGEKTLFASWRWIMPVALKLGFNKSLASGRHTHGFSIPFAVLVVLWSLTVSIVVANGPDLRRNQRHALTQTCSTAANAMNEMCKKVEGLPE